MIHVYIVAIFLHLYVIFVTKYRRRVLGNSHLLSLAVTFKELYLKFNAKLSEFNGECDHVHLLVSTSPNTPSVVQLVNSLKAGSSRRLQREFNDIAGMFSQNVLWNRSYFAGTCGSAPLDVIKQYIQQQDWPH
ncbi:IS200/IS605 family transposase [Candidatus Enterovibrio escicola]|uniref:IS200/IS605 family transposase n=1 Tax=Candidatus Enterovibrio escicola TaxID=1927127 RepID=UPI000BE42BA8|nr:IS200/IS605 family transposase [Candidatus Enterovibrio escacola]